MKYNKFFKSIPFKIKFLIIKTLGIGNKPDFLIIGAQKSGTTSLFNYIEKYASNFKSPDRKELQFFSEKYKKGFDWYKSRFPLFKKKKITGEATPDYLFYHKSAARIHSYLPNVKIIILLRDPVFRAYSQYNFQNSSSKVSIKDTRSFEEAVDQEIKSEFNINAMEDKFTKHYKYHSYIKRGFYKEQIEEYLKYFPLEQMLIIKSEIFFEKTQEVLVDVFQFIGLNFKKDVKFDTFIHNESKYNNSISENAYKKLKDIYNKKNEKLSAMIKKDIKWS